MSACACVYVCMSVRYVYMPFPLLGINLMNFIDRVHHVYQKLRTRITLRYLYLKKDLFVCRRYVTRLEVWQYTQKLYIILYARVVKYRLRYI